jgi:hypothetical protein
LGACNNEPDAADSPQPSTSASTADSTRPATSTSKSSSAASPPPPCPNPEGGACVGPLLAGKLYESGVFDPMLTYEVPSKGWKNFEDLYGNFLLVPPGNDLEGVNAGTSDYIGVFRAVLPSKLTSPKCGADWPLGTEPGPTPREMLSYYRSQRNLVVSNVQEVEVGSRAGVVMDLEAAPDMPLDHCREGSTEVEVNSVISGVEGSSFDHGVIRRMTMRLYLLKDDERVMGIEITDIHAAPATVRSMSRVVGSFQFDG